MDRGRNRAPMVWRCFFWHHRGSRELFVIDGGNGWVASGEVGGDVNSKSMDYKFLASSRIEADTWDISSQSIIRGAIAKAAST